MKLANPFYYPLAVLVGSIALVIGVRGLQAPKMAALPGAAAIATLTATLLKAGERQSIELEPALEQELQSVRQQAQQLAVKATDLHTEATRLLTQVNQIDLLGTVQYTCDRVQELPAQINQLAQRLHGSDSLLSVSDLHQQLQAVKAKRAASSGVAQAALETLASSLQANIQLAQQGQDARQAQVFSLSTLLSNTAGVLQSLQNKLRTADLSNSEETLAVRSLSNELTDLQKSLDLLVVK